MRALKRPSDAYISGALQPSISAYLDSLLLTADSGTRASADDHLNLLMLCTVREKMSPQQRVLLTKVLVKSFVSATHYVPEDARQVLVAAELPPVLERATRCVSADATWMSWTDNRRTWFVVARIDAELERGPDGTAIRILFYDEEGTCVSAGTWVIDSHGDWAFGSIVVADAINAVSCTR